MCAACVAQGSAYVGSALAGLQVMRVRARDRRLARAATPADAATVGTEPTEPDLEPAPSAR